MTDTYKQLTAKYRPRYFSDLVGQRVAVGTIESMLANGKINPTILITGNFGTGKTSLSRLIARYINCRKGSLGDICSPTDTPCISCRSIDAGNSLDVLEINAANARGIDDVRELIERSKLSPSMGSRRRVFICDEIHQWTPQSAQAMLKPLEEPAPKSIWILVTTDPQKVPATIRSRCMLVKLLPVTPVATVTLLKRITKSEKVTVPDVTLNQIAALSSGHVRNAVSMLESVLHYLGKGDVGELNLPTILDEMGMTPPDVLVKKYLQHVLNCDYNAIAILRKTDNLYYFISLVVKFLKGVIFVLAEAPIEDLEACKDFLFNNTFVKNFGSEDLLVLLELFVDAMEHSKGYDLDLCELLDLVTLKALEITKTFG